MKQIFVDELTEIAGGVKYSVEKKMLNSVYVMYGRDPK